MWGQEGKYSTTLFTQRARKILESHDPSERPLFLLLSLQVPTEGGPITRKQESKRLGSSFPRRFTLLSRPPSPTSTPTGTWPTLPEGS